LVAELALVEGGVAIVERRASQELVGSRSDGLPAPKTEVLDHRGNVDRFLRR
jgi:hypothetical protein